MTSKNTTVFNDPIYGFIDIDSPLIFDLIQHPYFQRLRRISQMGLSSLVYPGARHSRFEHALGAMHLMGKAVESLRKKGVPISVEEGEALKIAILLHDIGHGPFSHAMEKSIVLGVNHEDLSLRFMEALNTEFNGKLSLAISIFKNTYSRKFMHQLVSGQIDVDRMDYLRRDSFYTGATEGNINAERILSMITVIDDELVINEKGLHSVEKFLMARRLMYWQVYLHKTSLVAELLLEKTLQHARNLSVAGVALEGSPVLLKFLQKEDFVESDTLLSDFTQLDDIDLLSAIKSWQYNDDTVLCYLSKALLHRKLLKIIMSAHPIEKDVIAEKRASLHANFPEELHPYLVFQGTITNQAYVPENKIIRIQRKRGEIVNLQDLSDLFDGQLFSKVETKYYLCYPKIN